ncbi:MAG TPA: hypothetical protein VMT95_01365 [Candidatus Binatia bacterium]|nr:hypothetical protein [Candidatus Binatia bacterium]
MATVDCTARYRPIRGAFLVPDGSTDDLVKAVGLATLLWGGVYCPISPVSNDPKSAQGLIDLFNVDVLFPLAETAEINRLVESNRFLSFMHPYGMGLLFQDWHSDKHGISCLDVLHAINLCWTKEIKDIPPDETSHARLMRWDAHDPLANLFATMFGFFPGGYNLRIDFPRAFVRGLRGSEQAIDAGGALNPGLIHNITPIRFTSMYVEAVRDRWNSGVYVGDPASFEDLVSFWNLRASGATLAFYPLGYESRFEAYIKAFAASLKPDPPGPFLPAKFSVHSRDVYRKEATAFISALETAREKVLAPVDPMIWNGLNIKPSSIQFERHRVLASVDRRYNRPSVSFALPERRFLVDDDRLEHPHTSQQHLMVSVEPLTEFDYPDRTLRPPLIRRLNEFYSRQAALDPWALRCEKEGIAQVIDADESSISLFPIERYQIVERIFALAGITATPSLPGKMASRIIEKLGGTEFFEPGRVFKVRGARNLLRDTPASEKVSLESALGTIGGDRFDEFKNLHLAGQAGSELTASDVFNALIEKRVFVPKLKRRFARERKWLSCTKCGLSSKVKVKAFEGRWTCPYCDYEVYLPVVLRAAFSRTDIKKMWAFVRAGLFARDNNQEGFVPVVLALMWLNATLHNAETCFTTALDLDFEVPAVEIDFCVLQYKYGDHIELGLGEAKAAGCIDDAKVHPLKAAWKKLRDVGIDCFLVFAKASDEFADSEIEIFKRLKAEWIPIVALTNRELESYEPHTRDDDSPVRHPFTLSDMARNTDYRYLR